jgi:hypothetical protein
MSIIGYVFAHASDQLTELQIDGQGVPVLRILDEEHHQRSHNGGSGVDHQLPDI